MNLQPSIFVSHGAPSVVLEAGRAGQIWTGLGAVLDRPRAILVISAHWLTSGLEVTTHPLPETIHDFTGFPQSLYQISYPALGEPNLAQRVIDALAAAGFPARANAHRGLDHGAWVPLLYLYPGAEVPVVQLSLPATASPQILWEIGNALANLRETGVLVLGSGGVTHNLRELRMNGSAEAYARNFAIWLADTISGAEQDALIDYRRRAPEAARAHPSDEHFRPLFVALGAAGKHWKQAQRFDCGVAHGVLAMDAYAFGVPDALLGEMAALNEQKIGDGEV